MAATARRANASAASAAGQVHADVDAGFPAERGQQPIEQAEILDAGRRGENDGTRGGIAAASEAGHGHEGRSNGRDKSF